MHCMPHRCQHRKSQIDALGPNQDDEWLALGRGPLTSLKTGYWPPKTSDELVRPRKPIEEPYFGVATEMAYSRSPKNPALHQFGFGTLLQLMECGIFGKTAV